MYTWKGIILKLILNKQCVREWIRFVCQEGAVLKKYGEFLGYMNGS